MKIHQRNKLNTYITILQFLAANTTLWSAFTAFADAVALLTAKVAALQKQVAIQATHIIGFATAKKAKKKHLAEKVMELAGALQAYATLINDDVLFNFAHYTLSELKKQADTLLTETANNMHTKANSLIPSLAPYGIDAAYLLAFRATITDYASFVESPRLAKIARMTATANIKLLIKEIDAVFKKQLDLLILPIKAINNDFYLNYKATRKIIDIGHHHLPLIITGTVDPGQILNIINTTNPRWFAGITIKIRNTGTVTMHFYLANSADAPYPVTGATLLLPGEESTLTITAAEFKPFLNIQNPGPNQGTWEVTIL